MIGRVDFFRRGMMTSSTSDPMQVIVSPTFPLEWRDVDDFLGEFGPFNGRYVPRYPKDWIDNLRHHLEDIDAQHLPPRERAALFERLRRELLLCTTSVKWEWDDSKSWSSNVGDILGVNRDDMIVGDALDPSPYRSWGQAVGDIKRSRIRTLNFHGLVSEYVNLCAPLLVNSPGGYLIDPYLDPFSAECENLLLSFFDLIKGSKCYRLELITRQSSCGKRERSDPKTWMSKDEIQDGLKRIYRHRLPKDRSMVLHLVYEARSNEEGLTMHDRFFMTIHGAINFGHGFVASKKKQPIHNAFVVDKKHHELIKEIYINGVARHAESLPKSARAAYPKDVYSIELQS